MSITALTLIFAVVTLAAFTALTIMIARRLPAKMQARLDRRLAEHLAAATATAAAFEQSDGEHGERLARNYRFHRAAALSIDPRAEVAALPAARPHRARAA